jgi:hypothetical protein
MNFLRRQDGIVAGEKLKGGDSIYIRDGIAYKITVDHSLWEASSSEGSNGYTRKAETAGKPKGDVNNVVMFPADSKAWGEVTVKFYSWKEIARIIDQPQDDNKNTLN